MIRTEEELLPIALELFEAKGYRLEWGAVDQIVRNHYLLLAAAKVEAQSQAEASDKSRCCP